MYMRELSGNNLSSLSIHLSVSLYLSVSVSLYLFLSVCLCLSLLIGGSGTYSVVQCGAAGHNVRSKPNMKGTPIGRLAKGNSIEAIDEVC